MPCKYVDATGAGLDDSFQRARPVDKRQCRRSCALVAVVVRLVARPLAALLLRRRRHALRHRPLDARSALRRRLPRCGLLLRCAGLLLRRRLSITQIGREPGPHVICG